jgi:diacylglycerol kinase family enzyme
MNSASKRVAVVWNTGAGWDEGEQEAEQVREALRELDPDLHFERVNRGESIADLCSSCVNDHDADVLVAAGGDGTINAVAAEALKLDKALGVIPAGTLNHFARDLEVSLEPAVAARQLRDGREIQVDVGVVNGRPFLNNSVLGVYPVYRSARKSIESHGFGSTRVGRFFAVVGGILRVFWRLPHFTLRFRGEDGTSRCMKTAFVLIANNQHELEDWRIGHRTAIDRGELWVYVLRKCSRWSVLRYVLKFLMKRFSQKEAFEVFRMRELSIEGRRPTIRVGVDGEVIRMKTPLEYTLLPKALRVIAPPEYQPEQEPQVSDMAVQES